MNQPYFSIMDSSNLIPSLCKPLAYCCEIVKEQLAPFSAHIFTNSFSLAFYLRNNYTIIHFSTISDRFK